MNNIVYNWGVLPAEIVDHDSNTFLNFVGNYFIPGPSTQPGPYEILFNEGHPRIHVEGNLGPHRPDPTMDEWALVGSGYGEKGVAPETYRSLTKYATPPITSVSATEALEKVLAGAGATAPQRDAVDHRVVDNVRKGSGSIIDSPDDAGGYPKLASGVPPVDSDHDGMPDDWELEMGLDPKDASDRNGDLDGDGYTNIEEYLYLLSNGGKGGVIKGRRAAGGQVLLGESKCQQGASRYTQGQDSAAGSITRFLHVGGSERWLSTCPVPFVPGPLAQGPDSYRVAYRNQASGYVHNPLGLDPVLDGQYRVRRFAPTLCPWALVLD